MTVKTVTDADLVSFDSSGYPWCIVTSAGHVFYQTADLAAYQTAMTALGLTVDSSGNITITDSTTTDSTTTSATTTSTSDTTSTTSTTTTTTAA